MRIKNQYFFNKNCYSPGGGGCGGRVLLNRIASILTFLLCFVVTLVSGKEGAWATVPSGVHYVRAAQGGSKVVLGPSRCLCTFAASPILYQILVDPF